MKSCSQSTHTIRSLTTSMSHINLFVWCFAWNSYIPTEAILPHFSPLVCSSYTPSPWRRSDCWHLAAALLGSWPREFPSPAEFVGSRTQSLLCSKYGEWTFTSQDAFRFPQQGDHPGSNNTSKVLVAASPQYIRLTNTRAAANPHCWKHIALRLQKSQISKTYNSSKSS